LERAATTIQKPVYTPFVFHLLPWTGVCLRRIKRKYESLLWSDIRLN
jgi:hypothetical protein